MYLARRGYRVEVYDQNPDLRVDSLTSGKSSINLTLCDRGFRALDDLGVGDHIRSITLPVYGRMIHDTHGNLSFQHYGAQGQALYSIFRGDLNKVLLQYAGDHFDIDFHFHQKCVGLDLAANAVAFRDQRSGATTHRQADHIFGADGAFSAVRLQLQKTDRFNYSQQYMEYGYRELTIPSVTSDGWLARRNVIHFWPRGSYMLMGFSNVDGSFTLSLHLPMHGAISFDTIKTPDDLLELFERSFPDVVPQLPMLVDEYFSHATNSMVTIRCSPWTVRDRVTLMGDAAHAIVPYYGQGANAGFEDCAVLDACMDEYECDWARMLSEFERLRRPNTDIIADLALQNFIELRDRVGDTRFLLRKDVERRINVRYPQKYETLYSMIAFSSMPYAEAIRIDREQRILVDQIMQRAGIERLSDQELDALVDDMVQQASLTV